MDFKLLASFDTEVDAVIVKGWLEHEGVTVKTAYNDAVGTKTMQPNVWGLYVKEKDFKHAKHIISRRHRFKKNYRHAIGSLFILGIFVFLAAVAFIISKFI